MSNSDFIGEFQWTPEAETLLKNIPFFVRRQARKRIEQFAREEGLSAITVEVVERARLNFGQ
ncbi:MAG: PCP reductase family protein [Geitlerinemataceae cyanobacterium]